MRARPEGEYPQRDTNWKWFGKHSYSINQYLVLSTACFPSPSGLVLCVWVVLAFLVGACGGLVGLGVWAGAVHAVATFGGLDCYLIIRISPS